MAELFNSTRNNVTLHIKNIFQENELDAKSVCKESLLTVDDCRPDDVRRGDGLAKHKVLKRAKTILALSGYSVQAPSASKLFPIRKPLPGCLFAAEP